MDTFPKKKACDINPQMKRSRQPNWSETEKQLLITLTNSYHEVLDNKSTDSATLRRKAQVWDAIFLCMHKAGYNRSKERLKQQLGRMRAANVKKERDLITEPADTAPYACNFANTACNDIATDYSMKYKSSYTMPQNLNQDNFNIKIEQVKSCNNVFDAAAQDTKPAVLVQAPVITLSDDDDENVAVHAGKATAASSTSATGRLQKKLHYYRVAVERERLKTLQQQQKHERLLYRKDLQIQNLKVKILRNIIHHNHSNPINFC